MFLDGADDCGRIGTTVPAVERHHAETAVFRGFRGSRRMCSTGSFTLFCDVVGHHLRRVDGREIVVPIRDFAQQRSDARDRRDDGEGGVMPLDEAYVKGAAKLCEEYDLLLICDEVQVGNGRSGKLYGYMHYGIQPDIVSTAKGLAGGLPLGATLLGEKVQNVLTAGTHGSTFGGNPVCCAGAINVLNRLDENMLAGVEERSAYIKRELTGAKGVLGVSGLGLMIGIQTEKNASDIIAACREKGVLVIKAKDKLRLLPALNIPMEQLKKAVAVIKACCA